MPSLVLTLIGPDRPGLVESVARVVRAQNGNWLESRMAHLAGQFAGIVRVEVADEDVDGIRRALEGLETAGISITARRDTQATPHGFPRVSLDLIGNDRPGIVSEVARVLAENQVNVEEFFTECVEAPNSGFTLFKAVAQLRLPAHLDVGELQTALEGIALDLMVDIQLHPEEVSQK
jgi:glycine cleavage system regulatory protein